MVDYFDYSRIVGSAGLARVLNVTDIINQSIMGLRAYHSDMTLHPKVVVFHPIWVRWKKVSRSRHCDGMAGPFQCDTITMLLLCVHETVSKRQKSVIFQYFESMAQPPICEPLRNRNGHSGKTTKTSKPNQIPLRSTTTTVLQIHTRNARSRCMHISLCLDRFRSMQEIPAHV